MISAPFPSDQIDNPHERVQFRPALEIGIIRQSSRLRACCSFQSGVTRISSDGDYCVGPSLAITIMTIILGFITQPSVDLRVNDDSANAPPETRLFSFASHFGCQREIPSRLGLDGVPRASENLRRRRDEAARRGGVVEHGPEGFGPFVCLGAVEGRVEGDAEGGEGDGRWGGGVRWGEWCEEGFERLGVWEGRRDEDEDCLG